MEQAGKVDAHKTDQYTVGQWAEAWFENYAKPSIRETTAAYYKNYIDKHIVPNIGKIKLSKLTTLRSRNLTSSDETTVMRSRRFSNSSDVTSVCLGGLHFPSNCHSRTTAAPKTGLLKDRLTAAGTVRPSCLRIDSFQTYFFLLCPFFNQKKEAHAIGSSLAGFPWPHIFPAVWLQFPPRKRPV